MMQLHANSTDYVFILTEQNYFNVGERSWQDSVDYFLYVFCMMTLKGKF